MHRAHASSQPAGLSLVTQTFSAVEAVGHGARSNLEKSCLCQIKTSAVCASSSVVAVAAAAAAAVAGGVAGLGHVESAHEVVMAVAAVVDAFAVAAAADDVAGAVGVVGGAISGLVVVLVGHLVSTGAVSVRAGRVATVARATGVAVAVVGVRANAVAVASGVVVGVGGDVATVTVVAVATVAVAVAVVVVGRGGGGRNVLTDDAAADNNSRFSGIAGSCSCCEWLLADLNAPTHDGVLARKGDQLVAEDFVGQRTDCYSGISRTRSNRGSGNTLLDSATVGVLEWVSTQVLVELTQRSVLSAHLVADGSRCSALSSEVGVLIDHEV